MNQLIRRLRFVLRWVFVYNIRLVWLNSRLPRHIPNNAALDSGADEQRRYAQLLLGKIMAGNSGKCSTCGRCCQESVDRFTPFDSIVRRQTESPAPSHDRRIYSVWWMLWNATSHGLGRLFHTSSGEPATACPYQSLVGCNLVWHHRPMLCVSWLCLKVAVAMDSLSMDAAEKPLRLIEALHQDAVAITRRGSSARLRWPKYASDSPHSLDGIDEVGSKQDCSAAVD